MFRRGLFYSYLSIYLRFFLKLSVTETTLFASIPMVLSIVFQTLVWGRISDRYQRRRSLIITGEVLAALGTTLVWWLHTLPVSGPQRGYVIIIGFSIVEIFWSMSNIGWTALISDLYPDYMRTSIQGKLSTIGAAGRIIGVWIGGLVYDGIGQLYEGWGFDRGLLFFIASGVMVLSTIPILFLPEGGISRKEVTSAGSYSPKFLLLLLAMIFINFGRNSVAVIKTQYLSLEEGFDVSSQLLSYIVNMQSVAILIGGILIVPISKRVKDELLLIFGSIIGIAYLLGFVLSNLLPPIFLSNFLGGISDVTIMASSYSYASRLIPPQYRGRQFALYNATFFLSWGVGATLIGGPIIDLLLRSGQGPVLAYRISFAAAAVLVFIGLLLLIITNRLEER